MKKEILTSLMAFFAITVSSQNVYEIDLPQTPSPIIEGKLKVGGNNLEGGSISVNSYYLLKDRKPFIPIMGEFHYCRYPRGEWEEQLLKMKAGGINVVSTYVFWNIHEPYENHFVWTDNKDLRAFVQLCKKHNLQVIVRIGPFDHGEIRNGGLPDWLYTKPVDVRSDDSLYLQYTKTLFSQIAQQLKGLYYKDNGPIVGIQIENEHQHAAASWGLSYSGVSEYTSASYDKEFAHLQISPDQKKITTSKLGDKHMMTLKHMAQQVGMDVPIYTATGWGNAAVLKDEGLPVMAAYPYATWTDVTAMSPYCLFTNLRQTPDYSPVRFNPSLYPSIYAEMGCGIQMGYNLRPIVYPQGVATMLLRSLGSGSNGFGYYMYHGGSTPKMDGGISYYSEGDGSLPRISYDFQAPLGENGLEHESYRYLRLIHSFLNDFQDQLAPMDVVLPKNNSEIRPQNHDILRYAARAKKDSGYLFLINYQDHDSNRHDMDSIKLKVRFGNKSLYIPEKGTFCLPKDENIIIPFNLHIENALLKYSTSQLLMKLDEDGIVNYIFFAPNGIKSEYNFDSSTVKGKHFFTPIAGIKSTFTIKDNTGKKIRITTLTEQQALNAIKLNGKLLITPSTILPQSDGAILLNVDKPEFLYTLYSPSKGFQNYKKDVKVVKPNYQIKNYTNQLFTVHFNDSIFYPEIQSFFLRINYTADVAMAFLNNELIDDDFWHGSPWTIELNRFKPLLQKGDITIRLRPLKNNHPCLKTLPKSILPDLSHGNICTTKDVTIIPEYKLHIFF